MYALLPKILSFTEARHGLNLLINMDFVVAFVIVIIISTVVGMINHTPNVMPFMLSWQVATRLPHVTKL